jgi:TonB family protein
VGDFPSDPTAFSPEGSRVFRGDLGKARILDVIQLLNQGKKNGVLILAGGYGGRVFFDHGEIVAASHDRVDGGDGAAALAKILAADHGTFRFEAGPVEVERTILQPTFTLLLRESLEVQEKGRLPESDAAPAALELEPDGRPVQSAVQHGREIADPTEDVAPGAGITGLRKRMAGLGARIAALKEPVVGLGVEAAGLKERMAGLAGRVAGLEESIAASSARLVGSIRRFHSPRYPGSLSRARIFSAMNVTTVLRTSAVLVLLGSGYMVFATMRRPLDVSERADYQDIVRTNAEHRARIGELQHLVLQLSNSVVMSGMAGDSTARENGTAGRDSSARRDSLLAGGPREAPAERDGARRVTAGMQKRTAPGKNPVQPPADPPRAPDTRVGAARIDALRPASMDVPPSLKAALDPQHSRALIDRESGQLDVVFAWTDRRADQKDIGIKVVLDVLVDAAGGVQTAKVARSSGFPELDKAAVAAIRRFSYHPARHDGSPIAAWLQQKVAFKID